MPRRTTGQYERTTVGGEEAAAFVPYALAPVEPPIVVDAALAERLRAAEQALVRLELAGGMVPSLDWFIYAFVRKEAVLSSQIEGTQATLVDLLTFEAQDGASPSAAPNADVEEVRNYLDALAGSRAQPADPKGLRLSMRLVSETHQRLMRGVRGAEKLPGEVRRNQNWIGGSRPGNAAYVPPPPHALGEMLGAFEKYLHAADSLPPLLRAGLLHVQLETIHPYLDGNGRIGRLLVTLPLDHAGLRELAMATDAAMATDPRWVRITWADGTVAARFEQHNDGADRIDRVPDGHRGIVVHLRERSGLGVVRRFFRLGDEAGRGRALLQMYCGFPRIPIVVNGAPIGRRPVDDAILQWEPVVLDGVELGEVGLSPAGGTGLLDLVRDQVWLTRHVLDDPACVGLRGTVDVSSLRTDASLSDVVRDDRYGRVIAAVEAARDRALARWITAESAGASAPVGPLVDVACRRIAASRGDTSAPGVRHQRRSPRTSGNGNWCAEAESRTASCAAVRARRARHVVLEVAPSNPQWTSTGTSALGFRTFDA